METKINEVAWHDKEPCCLLPSAQRTGQISAPSPIADPSHIPVLLFNPYLIPCTWLNIEMRIINWGKRECNLTFSPSRDYFTYINTLLDRD